MMVSTRFSADIDAEYFSSEWKAIKNTQEDEIEEDTEGNDKESKKETFWQDRNRKLKESGKGAEKETVNRRSKNMDSGGWRGERREKQGREG